MITFLEKHFRIIIIGLGFYAFSASVLAWRYKSPTWDEVGHLGAGYAYLKEGRFELYHVNPPLAKEYAALPLLFMDLRFQADSSDNYRRGKAISFGREFLYESGNDPDKIFRWVRPWMAVLGALTIVILGFWLSSTLGKAPAILAAVLLASNPSYLAHLPLATTDVAFGLSTLLLALASYRYLERPSWRKLVVLGVTWGLCLSTKHTGLIYGPIVVGYVLWGCIRQRPRNLPPQGQPGSQANISGGSMRILSRFAARERSSRPYTGLRGLRMNSTTGGLSRVTLNVLGRWIVVGLAAGTVVWGTYGFQTSAAFQGPDDREKLTQLVQKIVPLKTTAKTVAEWLGTLRVPARPYLVSALDMLGLRPSADSGEDGFSRLKYLCGRRHPHGFHEFTLLAMLIKNPLPFLLATFVGLAFVLRSPVYWRSTVITFLATLFAVGTLKRDFAFRYFNLPMLPFMAAIGGYGLWQLLRSGRRYLRFGPWLVVAWSVCVPWVYFPHHLVYFNLLVGGPRGGSRCMLASNSDWGQDLPALARWQRDHGMPEIKLAYNGTVPPEYYGIRYVPLPGVDASTFEERPDPAGIEKIVGRTRPDTGLIAISTTCLYNIQGFYPGADYSWLLRFEPVAVLGYTIRIYEVRPDELNQEGLTGDYDVPSK